MRLNEALCSDPDANIYRVKTDWEERLESSYRDWELEPIDAPTLSASAVGGAFDGLFILRGSIVVSPGRTERAYLGMTLPECVSDDAYILEAGHVIQKSLSEWGSPKVIPAVAIESAISEEDPEVGLEVLRKGLAAGTEKCSIARVMATILRCEKRYQEAECAYSIAIDECPRHCLYYDYQDRALVREAMGDEAGAASDIEAAEKLARRSR